MLFVDNVFGMIADYPSGYAAKTVKLYKDAVRQNNMALAGTTIVREHFSVRIAERVLCELIAQAKQ